MRPTLAHLTLVVAAAAATLAAPAQEPRLPLPVGNWQSPASATHTHPAYTSSELHLDIDVARDGSFRGVWAQYFCTAYPGAYGIGIYSCRRQAPGAAVTGRFGADRRGVIELDKLGRSAFAWSAPAADELTIELPKNWQGSDAVLYRSRMTRDGKGKPPAATPPPTRGEGPPLSANALYREFKADAYAALGRHGGKTLVLDGRRGTLILLSDGGAAIHIADGFTARALVLTFRDLKEVRGIDEGALFRFRCTVANFDYQYVQLEGCSIVR